MSSEKKLRIMVVDDDKHLLISLRDHLIHEGFDVVTAKSGEDAIDVLKQRIIPDLVILDISMPGMGGVGFLKRITDEKGKPLLPILVHTARAAMEGFFENIEVAGFVSKPCDNDELTRKINGILGARIEAARKKSGRIRVLVAEDDPFVSRRIVDAMQKIGYEVRLVQDGAAVLDELAKDIPDVLLIKEVLPKMNGGGVTNMMEVMPSMTSVSVILYDDTQTLSSQRFVRPKCVKRVLNSAAPDTLIQNVKEVVLEK